MALILNTTQGRSLASPTDSGVVLALDPADTGFERQENNLVILGADGSRTEVVDFFVSDSGALPDFTLPDGAKISGSDLLTITSPDIDITTAAGPAASAPAGGGAGDYADGAGALLSGVDRLGSLLGGDRWERGSGAETAIPQPAPFAAAGGEAALPVGPEVPVVPETPEVPGGPSGPGEPVITPTGIAYQARAVLYTKDGGDDTLHIGIVGKDGMRINVNPDDVAREILLPEGVSAAYFEVEGVGADGQIVLKLTDAGRAALAAGENLFNYLRIGVGEHEYTVQLTVSPDNSFNSAATDADKTSGGYPEDGRLLYGEQHEGSRLNASEGEGNVIDAGASGGSLAFHDGGLIASGAGSANLITLHTAAGAATSVSLASNTHRAVMDAANGGKNIMDGGNASGAVDISLAQNNSAGQAVLHASGADAENSIRNVSSVHVTSESVDGNSGVLRAENGGSNTIANVDGEIHMANKSANSTLHAFGAGSANNILDTGSVTIDGRELSSRSSTLSAGEGGRNTIRGVEGDVTVHGRWEGLVAGSRFGQTTAGAENTISDVSGKVAVNADFKGMYAIYQGNANVVEDVKNGVSITVQNTEGTRYSDGIIAMEAMYGSANIVRDVTGDVLVSAFGRDSSYKSYAMKGGSGENRIENIDGNVELASTLSNMWATTFTNQPNGKNVISNVSGNVSLKSDLPQAAGGIGMQASLNSENIIENVGGDVEILARVRGMQASGDNAKNTISDVDGKVTIASSAYGMYAEGNSTSDPTGAANIIERVKGDLEFKAGSSVLGSTGMHAGMYADRSGVNKVDDIGGNVTIFNQDSGMHARYNSENSVSNIKGDVTISSNGSGLRVIGDGVNSIKGVDGDVDISGEYGLRVWGGVAAPGENIISDVQGAITVTGQSRALSVEAGGSNTIRAGDVSGIEVRISVPSGQGTQAYALYAEGTRNTHGANTIEGSRNADAVDYISITGDVATGTNGTNTIRTGAGKTLIELDGKIHSASALTIETNGEHDVLVLRATDAADFSARYQPWLTALAGSGIDITEVKVLISDNPGAPLSELGLGWLDGLFPGGIVESMTEDAYEAYRDDFLASAGEANASPGGASAARAFMPDPEEEGSGGETTDDGTFAGAAPMAAQLAGTAISFDAETIGRLQGVDFRESGAPDGDDAGIPGLDAVRDGNSLYVSLENGRPETVDAEFLSKLFGSADDVKELHLVVDQDATVTLPADSGWNLLQETSGVDTAGDAVTIAAYRLEDESDMLTLFIQQAAITG